MKTHEDARRKAEEAEEAEEAARFAYVKSVLKRQLLKLYVFLCFGFVLVQLHTQPRRGRQGHHAVDRLEWGFEEMLVDCVPLDQEFQQGTSRRRPGRDDVR